MTEAATGLDELYAAHAVQLNRYMYKLTGNREEAADLVHEVFLRLCMRGEVPDKPKEWMSVIGYRLFVDQWRRRKRLAELLAYGRMDDGFGETPEQRAMDKEFELRLRRLLEQMQPRERQSVYLRLFRHRTYEEIAALLGCPLNTVKSCVRRGKAKLARQLAGYESEYPQVSARASTSVTPFSPRSR